MSSDAEAPVHTRTSGSSRAPTRHSELKSLGKYQIERKLGAGGMGTVYLARDTNMRRAVALKVLPRDKAENPTLVKRFRAEASTAAQLKHEHIVAVYDTDEADGYLYIAMEFVDGIDLHELVNKRGTIPVKRSIEIIKQVASALQHASEQNIVHRDIKPSNLLIRRDGVVKLTDLGLARSIDDTMETSITRAGTTVGTVDYMAPEQAKNSKSADIRSDIYSLGCTWYHMLTGGPPFPEGSLTNKLQAHAVKPPPDPKAVNDQVTEGLVAVLHRMMAKKPEDRYQTPAELIKDLEGSTLTKAAFSQEILDAIDEESSTSVPVAGHSDKKPGAGFLPPPSRKRPQEGDDDKPGGINLEYIKLGIAVIGAAVVVGGLAWLFWSYGGMLDGPNQFGNAGENPFANQAGPHSVTVAPVGGTPGGATGTMINGQTPIAQIYAHSGAVQPGGVGSTNPLAPGSVGSNPNAHGGAASGSHGGATGTGPGGGKVGSAPGSAANQAPGSAVAYDPVKPPEWVAAAAKQSHQSLRALTVGPGATSSTNYNSLGEALGHVGGDGAVIQLVGNGPFLINSTVSISAKRLVISAGRDVQPLVVFAGTGSSEFGGLNFSGGSLEFKGVHFAATRFANESATLIAVREGSAILTGCSFTVGGPNAAGITVLSIDGTASADARLLLDQSVIRGDVKTAIELRSPGIDAVIRESLIASGSGTAVRLGFGSSPGGPPSVGPPLRSLKCLYATLASRERMFDLSAGGGAGDPPATYVSLVNSVCCTADSKGSRVLLDVAGFQPEATRAALQWTSQDSVFLGFEELVRFGDAAAPRIKDGDGWRIFWRQKVDEEAFRADVWPHGIERVAAASVLEFDSARLPEAAKKVSLSGAPPGVDVAKLTVPASLAPERLAALAYRRPMPTAVTRPGDAKATVKVDLKKEDLGVVLARGEWPDGAVIEAVGSGFCQMTPVQIGQRTVRIVFQQSPDVTVPLRLSARDTGKEVEALFRIEQGTLDLDGLRWQSSDGRSTVPQWMVSAVDANVVLTNCELIGPDRGVAPYQGVVRFATSAAPAAAPPALAIIDSFVHSPGVVVRADVGAGTLFVRNSLIVARGTALDLRPRAVGDELPLVVDIVGSTLAANQSVFQLTAASLTKAPRTPVRFFVDDTVFGPPFSIRASDASQPTLLTSTGPLLEPRQAEWWGQANGVSAEIKHFLRPEGSLPAPELTGPKAWNDTWGAGHELRLLTRADGVMLADSLPKKRDDLRPESYALHPNSKAIVWAEGRPIGADLAALEQVGPTKSDAGTTKAAPGASKKTQTPSTKPGANKFGF